MPPHLRRLPVRPSVSFDHLVSTGQKRGRNRKADLTSSPEIENQTVNRRLLHRQVSGASALEDSVHVGGGATELGIELGCISEQSALRYRVLVGVHSWQPVPIYEFNDGPPVTSGHR